MSGFSTIQQILLFLTPGPRQPGATQSSGYLTFFVVVCEESWKIFLISPLTRTRISLPEHLTLFLAPSPGVVAVMLFGELETKVHLLVEGDYNGLGGLV